MIHRTCAIQDCFRADTFAGPNLNGAVRHRLARYCRMLTINCTVAIGPGCSPFLALEQAEGPAATSPARPVSKFPSLSYPPSGRLSAQAREAQNDERHSQCEPHW